MLGGRRSLRWLLLALVPLWTSCAGEPPLRVEARDGSIDLRDWRPGVDGPVRLDGVWDFYWRQLVGPGRDADAPPVPITVPRFWHRTPVAGPAGEVETTAGPGFGTYRLRVRLPPDPPPLALRLVNINSAVAVYAEGRLVWRAGRVADEPERMVSAYGPGVALLPPLQSPPAPPGSTPDGPELDLVVQIANFENSRGGIDDPVWLGPPQDLIAARTRTLAHLGLVVGGLLIMGLYHLVLYALRRRSRIALYFGLVCLCAVGRLALSNELLALELWPGLGWDPLVRGMYFFAFAIFGTFALYLDALWPRAAPTWVYRTVAAVAAVAALATLVLPVPMIMRGVGFLEGFVVACLLMSCLVFVGAQRRREEGRWLYLGGFVFVALGASHDVVVSQGLLSGGLYLGPIGVFVFLLAQSAILAQRFARSLTTVESQRSELLELVDRLERERRERERYEELSLAASGLAHETKNPLGIIRGLAQRLAAAPDVPPSTRRRASQILDQADLAASRLGDFLSYARLRDPKLQAVDPGALLRYAVEVLAPDLDAQSIPCRVEATDARALADEEMLLQIVLNLMLNSIAASGAGDELILRFEAREATGLLTVIDHGTGIAPDRLEAVRKPYISDRSDGHGLGLALVERLAELHGWRLEIESTVGVGTRVTIDGLEVERPTNPPPRQTADA